MLHNKKYTKKLQKTFKSSVKFSENKQLINLRSYEIFGFFPYPPPSPPPLVRYAPPSYRARVITCIIM